MNEQERDRMVEDKERRLLELRRGMREHAEKAGVHHCYCGICKLAEMEVEDILTTRERA